MEQDLSRRLVWLVGDGAQGARLESALGELGATRAGASCERFESLESLDEAMQRGEPELVLVGAEILGGPDEFEGFVASVQEVCAAQIPLVVVTDDASVEMRRRMFAAGVNDFVLEPVVVPELLTRVRSQLVLRAESSRSGSHRAGTHRVVEAGAQTPLSILVADAEPMIQRVLRSAFERRDWSVSTVSDGREALQFSKDTDFDLVVFDLNLPFVNGYELLGEFGGPKTSRRPWMVVLSAEKQHESVLRAFELGADDFVDKPVNPDILVARIDRLVRPAGGGESAG